MTTLDEAQHSYTILLPQQDEATALVDKYLEQLDPVLHFVHAPSLKQDLNLLYEHLDGGGSVDPNQTVLLLAILSSMSSYWDLSPCTKVFSDPRAASHVAGLYARMTLDVLEHGMFDTMIRDTQWKVRNWLTLQQSVGLLLQL